MSDDTHAEMDALQGRAFVGTESRLHIVVELLRQIVHGTEAAPEARLAELHRRGFETEVRVVETEEKGRWWRVYVGDFASRAEARAAAPLLKKELRTDWANPTRF